MEEFSVNRLGVEIHENTELTGRAAAHAVAERLRGVLAIKSRARTVFAAAPSQDSFLSYLTREPGIDWRRIDAMDMDEYVGLADSDHTSFAHYLDDHLFRHVPIGSKQLIDGGADVAAELTRYEKLLDEAPIDVMCLGIGENGHLAFNEPDAADTDDSARVREVVLSDESRWQQVHDGCFDDIKAVPTTAITLTIPSIIGAECLFVAVPGRRKARAVMQALLGPIEEALPASLLRLHPAARLFLDRESAAELPTELVRGTAQS